MSRSPRAVAQLGSLPSKGTILRSSRTVWTSFHSPSSHFSQSSSRKRALSRAACRYFAWPRDILFASPTPKVPSDSVKTLGPLPSHVFPEPKFTLNRGSLATKVLDGYKFVVDGAYTEVQYSLSALRGVHARDFLHLDVFKSPSQEPDQPISRETSRLLPTILPRGNCIIVSISHIKAIICHDHVFLMDIHRPVVRHFAEFLKTFLHVVQTHANPLLALQTGLHQPHDETLEKELDTEDKDLVAALENSLSDQPKNGGNGNHKAQARYSEPPLDFEFRVLEAILSFAVAKYERRIQLYEPVVADLLKRMILDSTQIEYDALHRLLPINNALSVFERSTNEVINVLKDLLNNTEDMLEMSLTEKFRRAGELPPTKQHEECELLLESYLREISHVNRRAFALRKTIQTSQDLLNISLDNYRNQIMRVNVQLASASVGLTVGTVGVGLFGMNLVTGLESNPNAFMIVSSLCLGCAAAVYQRLGRLALPQNLVNTYPGVEHTKALAPFLNSLAESDIQDIVLHRLGTEDALTKKGLLNVLEEATGKKIDPRKIDLVFRVFDSDDDGVLSRGELMKFLCDVHNRFTSRTVDGK